VTYSRTASGLWLPGRALGALPSRLPLPPDAGTSGNPEDHARGFVPASDAASARARYQQTSGTPPWVPTTPSEIGPWAKQQAAVFASKEIQDGIKRGAKVFETDLHLEANFFPPMPEGAIEEWVKRYTATNGFPVDGASGVRMARAFVIANTSEIGLPPEFIAASELVTGFPDTPEQAVFWAVHLGTSFLSSFGVPIVDVSDASSFLSACARAGVSQFAPGVPFELFEATFSALSDGRVTNAEAKGIVLGAAAFVGAAIGQAFGLPAPIGAFLSQIMVAGLVEAFGWGPTDSDKLKAAQDTAAAAAATASRECEALSIALWLEYQHYWQSISDTLSRSIRDAQGWLAPSGSCGRQDGIRLFATETLDVIRDAYGNPLLANPAEVKKGKAPKYRTYPYPLTRVCSSDRGCPYLTVSSDQLVTRDEFALSPEALKRVPSISKRPPGCDAASALSFWGARRYTSPNQVFFAMRGKPDQWVEPSTYKPTELKSYNVQRWEEIVHSDYEYLTTLVGHVGTVNFGTAVGPCPAPAWAAYMFKSLEQAAAAVALVERDLTRTVSAATTEYGIKYHMEQAAEVKWEVASAAQKRAAARTVAARAAGLRHAALEAKKRGRRKADLVNYGLLTAGGAALLGVTLGRMR